MASMLQRKVAATARRDGGESASKENGRTSTPSWSDRWKNAAGLIWPILSAASHHLALHVPLAPPHRTGGDDTGPSAARPSGGALEREGRGAPAAPGRPSATTPRSGPSRRPSAKTTVYSRLAAPPTRNAEKLSAQAQAKGRRGGGGGKGPVRSIARLPRGGSPRLPHVAVERKGGGSERGKGDGVHQAPPAAVADRHCY